jgi:DNA repair protein RecO (recombination protein O)
VRVDREAGYVLHTRDYRETSLLLEVYTRHYGRLSLIAKGAKRKKSPFKGSLTPFLPLYLSWVGKGELATLSAAEPAGSAAALKGNSLYCGFYINELLMYFLHKHDPHERLFDCYQIALASLVDDNQGERSLRLFEKQLLKESGYALILDRDVNQGLPIDPGEVYSYIPEQGPVVAKSGELSGSIQLKGASLLALEKEQFDDEQSLPEVKQLMRAIIDRHLGGRPIYSRKMFYRHKRN